MIVNISSYVKVLDYDELVAEGGKNNILAVSNPAFELFLLLHYENSYEDDIEQEKKINEDIHQCKGQITCNIVYIIDEIRKDDGKSD